MNIINKKLLGNETGNAGVAVIVIIIVVVVWFIFTSILGWIQKDFEGKKQKNHEREEMRRQEKLPKKAFKAQDRQTVVKY